MSEIKPIKDYLTNNTIRTYYALDESMIKAHQAGQYKEAEETARTLLTNSDLPLLLRARACQIIGCGTSPDFLDMAKEGVRIAEMAYGLCDEPGEVEQDLVAQCKEVLKEAQEAFDEMKKDGEETTGDTTIRKSRARDKKAEDK